jgi:glyoxylase-like metal-dependent hydrolase (beta-lactamase superfamily II)
MMKYATRSSNVYMIDTMFFGYEKYSSVFIVKGKEIALVDTGLPNQFNALLSGMKSHGFTPADINYVFVTHEHADHSGNVAPLLEINPKIKVFCHPACKKQLIDPEGELSKVRGIIPKRMLDGLDGMKPVPASAINYLNDGDIFDLGDGEKLKVVFAPGHQPSGIVILEEKFNGLFINDLIGNYFADADFHLILTPINSDLDSAIKSLKRLSEMSVSTLFLGHFGIYDKPTKLLLRVISSMQNFMDIAAECVARGQVDQIAPRLTEIKVQEAKKLLKTRPRDVYEYTVNELVPPQSGLFAKYYLNLKKG